MCSLKVKMENMYLDNFIKSKTNTDIFIPHQKNIVLRNESKSESINKDIKSKSKIKDKGKKKTGTNLFGTCSLDTITHSRTCLRLVEH